MNTLRPFDYGGTVNVSNLVGNQLAASEADTMTNTTVELQGNVVSFFLNVLTLGIATARTIRMRGNLVNVRTMTGAVSPPSLDTGQVDPGHQHGVAPNGRAKGSIPAPARDY